MTAGMPSTPAFLAELASGADGAATALVEAASGHRLTYAALAACAGNAGRALGGARRTVAFLLAHNDVATIVALFALRSAGHVVVLIDATLDGESLRALMSSYDPELVVGSRALPLEALEPVEALEPLEPLAAGTPDPAGERTHSARTVDLLDHPSAPGWSGRLHVLERTDARHDRYPAIDASLALCLATSGSTGSPKLVRLSEQAVVSNAKAIAGALAIAGRDRAITCLPLHYAYGLSILTSHLAAGAAIVVTEAGLLTPELWTAVRTHGVSALAAVPYGYEMLARLGFERTIPECVRIMTQAGGKLSDDLAVKAADFMRRRGGRFHVMYGQTEATARIAVMPSEWLPERVGAVGRAVPGGTIEACDERGHALPPGMEGEIRYRGPNVMLGYATDRAELALGDTQHGTLRTGDLGVVDADGCLRITGRLKRIGKLFGTRVDLDAVERIAAEEMPVAVIDGTDRLILFAATADTARLEALRARVASRLKVQQRVIELRAIETLPRTSAGKVDYPKLRACV